MTPDEARTLLGVRVGDPMTVVLERFRALQRRHHPDVSGDAPGSTEMSARLNEALSVLRADDEQDEDAVIAPTTAPTDEVDGATIDVTITGDSLFVDAPPDETFLRLLEAGVGLGGIGHVDPRLGLLELIVRFEGGPSCSVLLTLQGRSHGTEVFCEMESIEARPTPSIAPVMDELATRLAATHDPAPLR